MSESILARCQLFEFVAELSPDLPARKIVAHICRLLAEIKGVGYSPEDWRAPAGLMYSSEAKLFRWGTSVLRYVAITMLACTFGCKSQQDNSFSRGVGPMLTATVVNYDSGVEWDQYDDESFDVRDQLQLAVAPDDRPLIVSLSPHELPDDSPFRIAGTRFTFQPDKPLTTETQLFCGALNRPTVLGSNGH